MCPIPRLRSKFLLRLVSWEKMTASHFERVLFMLKTECPWLDVWHATRCQRQRSPGSLIPAIVGSVILAWWTLTVGSRLLEHRFDVQRTCKTHQRQGCPRRPGTNKSRALRESPQEWSSPNACTLPGVPQWDLFCHGCTGPRTYRIKGLANAACRINHASTIQRGHLEFRLTCLPGVWRFAKAHTIATNAWAVEIQTTKFPGSSHRSWNIITSKQPRSATHAGSQLPSPVLRSAAAAGLTWDSRDSQVVSRLRIGN